MEKDNTQNLQTQFIQKEISIGPDIQKDMLDCLRMLKASGVLSSAKGNISTEVSEGMYTKASGVPLSEMTLSDLVLVLDYRKDKGKVLVKGDREPEDDIPIHWHIYKWFSRASAVIHLEDQKILENPHLAREMKLKVVPEKERSLEEYKRLIGDSLVYDDYVLVEGYGAIAIGNDIGKATDLVLSVHKRMDKLKMERQ